MQLKCSNFEGSSFSQVLPSKKAGLNYFLIKSTYNRCMNPISLAQAYTEGRLTPEGEKTRNRLIVASVISALFAAASIALLTYFAVCKSSFAGFGALGGTFSLGLLGVCIYTIHGPLRPHEASEMVNSSPPNEQLLLNAA